MEKRSVDELFMHYFHNLSSASGGSAPSPPLGLHPWSRWRTFVPRPIICPPLEKNTAGDHGKRYVFSKRLKTASDELWGIASGRPFHAREPATVKARSPNVEHRVARTTRSAEDAEHRRYVTLCRLSLWRLCAHVTYYDHYDESLSSLVNWWTAQVLEVAVL